MIFRRGEGWPRRQAVSSMDAMNIQIEPWPLGVGRGARRASSRVCRGGDGEVEDRGGITSAITGGGR